MPLRIECGIIPRAMYHRVSRARGGKMEPALEAWRGSLKMVKTAIRVRRNAVERTLKTALPRAPFSATFSQLHRCFQVKLPGNLRRDRRGSRPKFTGPG